MNKTELKARADRYVKVVEWSDEDACFVGTCLGLMFVGIHGDDVGKVHAEPCLAEEEVIDLMKREGRRLPPAITKRKFSGKVLLRLAPAVLRRLALQAKAGGESLDALVTRKLVTVQTAGRPRIVPLPDTA